MFHVFFRIYHFYLHRKNTGNIIMSLLLHPLIHFERVGNVYLYLLIPSVEFDYYTRFKVFLIFFKVFPSFLFSVLSLLNVYAQK